MNKIADKSSLHEKAVQKVAKENLKHKKVRGKGKRKPNTAVKKSHWSDGVDPRIVAEIKAMNIPMVHKRIEVKSPTEVIIHNEGWSR